MSVYQGDFLGFSLGNEHSYGLNITRVSTNDRYVDGLIPNFTDSTVQVPGGDGTYYWDTNYTSKTFNIDFAFDDLRDEDLQRLRQICGFKGIQPIVFDEFPYKKYMVKCSQPPQLRYLCFDHQDIRVYKGEGNMQLVAYYPFAFGVVSPVCKYDADGAAINNKGDLPAFLKIIYDLSVINSNVSLQLKDKEDGNQIGFLSLNNINAIGNDVYILINTQTQLIEGLDVNKEKTGNLYNKFIESGDFFNPPVGRSWLISSKPYVDTSYTPMFY